MGGNRQYADDDAPQRLVTSRPRAVMQAGMELPDHAKQQLNVGNSMPGEDDGSFGNEAGGFNRMASAEMPNNPGRRSAGSYGGGNNTYGPSGMTAGQAPNMMRQVNQPMPLPINGGAPSPYRQAGMQSGGEMMGAPQPLRCPFGKGSV
jgi:hypothetical protein